jgi:hypothetical protein
MTIGAFRKIDSTIKALRTFERQLNALMVKINRI